MSFVFWVGEVLHLPEHLPTQVLRMIFLGPRHRQVRTEHPNAKLGQVRVDAQQIYIQHPIIMSNLTDTRVSDPMVGRNVLNVG